MMDKYTDSPRVLGSMFVGTAISFILHGVACCQAIWYFRHQSCRSSKSMKALIGFIWLGETLNCVFMSITTLHAFLSPAFARVKMYRDPCRHWSELAQVVASAMCTFSVEGFFIMRMWRFSEQKKLTALAFIPYLIGHAVGFARIIQSFRLRCNPGVSYMDHILIFVTCGCRLFSDGVVVSTMCYMLYVRSLGFMQHTNTIKIVRGLILWSISTGVLTWLNTALYLASHLDVGKLPPPVGFCYVRAGLYANAMLAQLNARPGFRAMAQETIPFSPSLDTLLLSRRVHHEVHPLEPVAE